MDPIFQKQTPRAPASEPSFPRRDSMEDANASLTRKRPRLGSGGRETRSMSADLVQASSIKFDREDPGAPQVDSVNPQEDREITSKTPQQASRVTINVRSQQQSPTQPVGLLEPASTDQSSTVDAATASLSDIVPSDPMSSVERGVEEKPGDRADSPTLLPESPVVEIRIDDSDDAEVDPQPTVIEIGEDAELDITQCLESFPYSAKFGYLGAATQFANHIHAGAYELSLGERRC